MADLMFKKGLLANLSTQEIVNGTIYVTTDERAMYVDLDGNRLRLGDFQVVANVASLPTANQHEHALWYAINENVLCRWNGTTWVQINKQAQITDILKGLTASVSAANNVATISTSALKPTGVENTAFGIAANVKIKSGDTDVINVGAEGTDTIVITGKDVDHSIDMETSETTSGAKIGLTLTKSGTAADGSAINETEEASIELAAAGAATRISQADNKITITGAALKESNAAFDADGNLTVTVKDTFGNSTTNTGVAPTISYGNGKTAKFEDGVAVLDVYDKQQIADQIRESLQAADAMTFKGIVDAENPLPTTGVRAGDTYKVALDGQYANISTDVGDLLIATGTEGADGTLTSITWVHVPSGDDTVYRYTATVDGTNGITLKESVTGNDIMTVVGDGAEIKMTADNSNKKLTLRHATHTAEVTSDSAINQSAGGNATFTGVTGITVNEYGHVTGYSTGDFKVVDTTADDMSFASSAVGTDKRAVNVKLKDHMANETKNTLVIASNNLDVTASTDAAAKTTTVNVSMSWGSF